MALKKVVLNTLIYTHLCRIILLALPSQSNTILLVCLDCQQFLLHMPIFTFNWETLWL